MTYTYIALEKDQSWLHSCTKAMIIFEDGNTWEFIHNFPSAGPVTIEKLMTEWTQAKLSPVMSSFIQFVMQWRNRRKWGILRNKHFFDCFVLPDRTHKQSRLDRSFLTRSWWQDRS